MKTAIAALAVLVVAASAGAATDPTLTGRIVFSANDGSAFTGHIFVAQPGKAAVDLSRSSGGFDSAPAVSSDGKQIAFASTRSGRAAIYTMAIDGTHVARVSPFFAVTATVQIAWEPGAQTFAVGLQPSSAEFGRIYLGTLGGGWRLLVTATDGEFAGWSPDGKLLAYDDIGGPVAVDVRGRRVFELAGLSGAWSATGRLAVQANTTNVAVYSEAGKQLAAIGGATAFAWSPDGAQLATLTARGILQVRTGGVGRPVSSRKIAGRYFFELQWLGETHVRVNGNNGWLSFDVRTGKEFVLPAAFSTFGSVLDAAGTEAAAVTVSAGRASVLVGTLKTSRVVDSYPECGDDPLHDGTGIDGLQLIAGGGLVYESDCTIPSASIYSVAPDGSHLTRLTDTPADDEQVAVSSDASMVAFVRASAAVCHDGCFETIWTMNADGSGARLLVAPSDELPYNDSPSFSPNGTQILFSQGGAESTELETVPAAGGDLHGLGVSGQLPAWGPVQIAYDDGKTGAATVANPDGSQAQPVATAPSEAVDVPAWSADGRLALLEQRGSTLSILDVSTGRRVTLAGFEPPGLWRNGLAWSPDGTRFAFTAASPKDPYGDVWTIGVDGTGLTQVTHGLGAVSSLAWR